MLKVAITGNIASGKSTVEKILQEKNYKVLDADIVAHDLLKNKNVETQLKEIFKDYDILENDKISRSKLAKIVFDDEILRKKLESILHPLVKDEIERFFYSNKNEKIIFVSIPLLFEAGFEKLFDKIILVLAEDETRLQRLMKRNDLSEEHAKNRINIQLCQNKKIPLVDYVIYNNGSIEDLLEKVERTIVNFTL